MIRNPIQYLRLELPRILPAIVFPLFRMIPELKGLAPLDTSEVLPGVLAVRDLYVNLFLVKGLRGYIAIDSGINPKNVAREIKKLNVDPMRVSALFLTHADPDHIGGLQAFSNATIYLSSKEMPLLDGRATRFGFHRRRTIPRLVLLNDGQIVALEQREIRMIPAPGHTPGSAGYLIDGRLLFTGDATSFQGKGLISRIIHMDRKAFAASLRKLSELKGVSHVFSSHFGCSDSIDALLRRQPKTVQPKR